MSTKNAGLAKKDGYNNVRVFIQGQPAWIKAGYPVYPTRKTIESGNILLIDLRSAEKSAAGRIPRSVTIPYETLEDRLDDIPAKAPVVLYSDSEKESTDAVKNLRSEGFKKVALVPGNYDGWVKEGAKIVKGPVVTDITWKRIPGKGEVILADFNKALSGGDSNIVILDVRTPEETAQGSFKNALTVPLDQLGSRLNEIPKDKTLYVYCSTGARAEMAAHELKKNGYKAFFLVADVECEDNECEIDD